MFFDRMGVLILEPLALIPQVPNGKRSKGQVNRSRRIFQNLFKMAQDRFYTCK